MLCLCVSLMFPLGGYTETNLATGGVGGRPKNKEQIHDSQR